MEGEWKIVAPRRKEKSRLQKEKWDGLTEKCSHIITPSLSRNLRSKFNVDGIEEFFMSDKIVNLQIDGWIYEKILKSVDDEIPDDSEEWIYRSFPVNNDYGDCVLFKRSL